MLQDLYGYLESGFMFNNTNKLLTIYFRPEMRLWLPFYKSTIFTDIYLNCCKVLEIHNKTMNKIIFNLCF